VWGSIDSSSQQNSLRVRVLRSGSAGNAILVEADGRRFLIDAGLPAETLLREITDCCPTATLDAILLTHEHEDHIKGAAGVARATGAAVLVNDETLRAANGQLAGVAVETFRSDRPFQVGAVGVTPFRLPHDAADPVGFALDYCGVRAAVACDLGEVTDVMLEHARAADLFLIEANYDLRLMSVSAYPWFLKNRIISPQGHLSNDGAAQAAVGVATGGSQTIMLVHLSEVNNLAPLARDIVRAALDAEGMHSVRVEAIRPNSGGPWWTGARIASTAAAG
jgi:phosphoribosyl 1,2-cyclic phosphodiesterase